MNKKQDVKCLFEHHEYTIPDKTRPCILICEHCKRFGYYKSRTGRKTWYEYDENGHAIHCRFSGGFEVWFNERGTVAKLKEASRRN